LHCRPRRTQVHITDEAQAVDERAGRRADPEFAAQVAAALREDRRRRYGARPDSRPRHVVKKRTTDYVPPPYTLREPEPELPSEEQIEAARQARQQREVQRLAEQRAQAEKAGRDQSEE
jgi:hypothetical protein